MTKGAASPPVTRSRPRRDRTVPLCVIAACASVHSAEYGDADSRDQTEGSLSLRPWRRPGKAIPTLLCTAMEIATPALGLDRVGANIAACGAGPLLTNPIGDARCSRRSSKQGIYWFHWIHVKSCDGIFKVSNADEPSAADRPQPNQSKDRAGVSGRRYRAGSANSKGNRKQRKKRKSRACMARAPDLRRCRCNLRLRILRYLRFPFLASMRYPTRHDPCGKGSGETARYGQCIGK